MKHRNLKTRHALITTAVSAALFAAPAALAGGEKGEGDWTGEMKDAWLDGKIETSYTLNRYLNPFEINTDVEKGVVMLTGTVGSEIDKELAEEIAQGTEGVDEVVNELTVEPADDSNMKRQAMAAMDSFEQRFNDATTTARVKFALLANDKTEGLQIDVDTKGGVVTLDGEVDNDQVMELAERIAENAEGVASVKNELRIAGAS